MTATAPHLSDLIADKIHDRTGRRVAGLAVEVTTDAVTIRGQTNTFHVKQLVLQAVREMLPQTPVKNAIAVG